MLTGNILITGGTGSLGKALLRSIEHEGWDCNVTVMSRDETKQGQVKALYPQHRYVLGDVANERDVMRALIGQDYVFHFAAYKQVPAAQNNVHATIKTNIIGSQNIVDYAVLAGVKKVVASSTDKACAPINAYGASKSLMETIFQNGNKQSNTTTFHLARYGNVVCSNSSVIPLFQRQVAAGQPITVTHRMMTRFWITLDDAIDLILKALNAPPGCVVAPKAGAKSVMDIARIVAACEDYPIRVIGIRTGEKIHGAMVSPEESFYTEIRDFDFLIHPPTAPDMFHETQWSYTSDKADEIPNSQIVAMIREYSEKYA